MLKVKIVTSPEDAENDEQQSCIGCGFCAGIAPEVFAIEDGASSVIKGVKLEDHKEDILKAAEQCPVKSIIVKE